MRLNENIEILTKEAISFKALIETPSFSSEEDKTAVLVELVCCK
jgi:acetylornithine deacetylase